MNDFRRMALALPGAVEQDHFGAPSFRVEDKIFAQMSGDGCTVLVKLKTDVQADLLRRHPNDCWPEARWGRFGWTGIRWQTLDRTAVADVLEQSWRAVRPKRPRP